MSKLNKTIVADFEAAQAAAALFDDVVDCGVGHGCVAPGLAGGRLGLRLAMSSG